MSVGIGKTVHYIQLMYPLHVGVWLAEIPFLPVFRIFRGCSTPWLLHSASSAAALQWSVLKRPLPVWWSGGGSASPGAIPWRALTAELTRDRIRSVCECEGLRSIVGQPKSILEMA